MGSGSLVAARLLAHLGCHAGPPPLESRSRRGQEAEAGDGAEQRRRPPAGHGAAEGSAAAPAPAAGRLLLAPCGGGATVTHPPRGRSGPCLASGGVQGRGGAAVAVALGSGAAPSLGSGTEKSSASWGLRPRCLARQDGEQGARCRKLL